jgi:septum formation protein
MQAASTTSFESPAACSILGSVLIKLSMVTAYGCRTSLAALTLDRSDFQSKIKNPKSKIQIASQCSGEARPATSGGPLSDEHLIEDVLKEKLILASGSPRRAEILTAVGWPFEVSPANIDESRFDHETAVPYVTRLAQSKAETVANRLTSGLVLGADTVVLVDEQILGQPRDAEDARRMLNLLSGRWHEVVTGVALLRAGANRSAIDHETTRVRFVEMTTAEIDWYVGTGEPTGKAGAYGVQGGAAFFIEEIQGTYFNIVGLPVRLVYKLARQLQGV